MCGICGIAYADPSREVPAETLRRMRESLAHRGPDGHGERRAGGVGLAHTRLSIIDVAGGTQPLANEDGSVWVTFNGEIYNYVALMDRLRAAGHLFHTRSDTEVLVHLYEERGLDFVRELNGMFAFALHDTRRNRVVLARDHFGIKPLFYAVKDGALVFGSEIKAVLTGLNARAATRTAAVQEYLMFRCTTADRSFYDGVHRLLPGSVAVWENGRLSVRQFWLPPAPTQSRIASLDAAAAQLETHLDPAVQSQLMSEVPLGTFCSGGVDSGLTTVYASRASDHQLHTFSVGFNDPAWDESALAKDTARRAGTDHHVLIADANAYHRALPRLLWHHDEPLGHPNSVLIGLLSGFARQFVTVVLTGEGSDEIFGGYPRHHIVRVNALASRLPHVVRDSAGALLRSLGGRKARMLGKHLSLSFPEAVALNSSYVDAALVERLTGSSPRDVVGWRVAEADALAIPGNAAASVSRYDQRTYLPCLLDRMDRMTMAYGLEGRVPFLDVGLAEWAGTVPARYRLGWTGNKMLVKRLAERYLSRGVTHGPKSGFGVPVGDWLRTPAWSDMIERLRDKNHPATSSVDAAQVGSVVDAHLSGAPGLGDVMWLLTNLYLWHETASAQNAGETPAIARLA